jgi:hypothetical protein
MSMGRAALAIALLATGCAQVREITGGERDSEGPQLVDAYPANGTTRFSGDRFVVRFDERIQIERSRAGLPVSPPMDPPPTLHLRSARELEVRLHAPLKPATTYTFAIGEAVKDLTEGNRAVGLDYAFSTGDHLDSLRITGTLIDAFTGGPQDQALVMLLEANDTSAFTTGRPAFVTRSDRDGRFTLARLPGRDFSIVALRDLNGNYRYDLPNEEIAFLHDSVKPLPLGDSTAQPVVLRMFKELSASQQIREATVTENRAWQVLLAKPAQLVGVRDIARTGGSLTWLPEWSAGRDSLLLWPSDTTAVGEGRYAITTEAGELDTLRYRPLRPMPYLLQATAESSAAEGGMRIRFTAARPIRSFDPKLMQLRADSLDIPFEMEADTGQLRQLVVSAALPVGLRATFTMQPNALRDIYGGGNDTLRFAVGVAEANELGTLRITLAGVPLSEAPHLLELLDAQGRSVRRAEGGMLSSTITWDRLQPGNHTLRLIEDRNGNGRWDPGEWRTMRQPERVWRHVEPTNVRAAWDVGVEWRLAGD